MNSIAYLLIALLSVPQFVSGPELEEKAVSVKAPISNVTVYSDRAMLERTSKIGLSSGINVLKLPDLPGAVMLDTIRLEADGAKVLRIETVPIEKERMSIEQVDVLIDKIEALRDKIKSIDSSINIHQKELNYLNSLSPKAAVVEQERKKGKEPYVSPENWITVLSSIEKRQGNIKLKIRQLSENRIDTTDELYKVKQEVNRHNIGAFSEKKINVFAVLKASKKKNALIKLSYFIPGAYWIPAYNIYFSPENKTVNISTNAMVSQATGEDWKNIEIALSTAIPGLGIEMPELLTWTLGEKGEYIPKPKAAKWPKPPSLFALPTPKQTLKDTEQKSKKEILRQRVNELISLMRYNPAKTSDRIIQTAQNVEYMQAVQSKSGGNYGYSAKEVLKKPSRYNRNKKQEMPSYAQAAQKPSYDEDYELEEQSADDYKSAPQMIDSGGEGFSFGISSKKESKLSKNVIQTSLNLFEPGYYRPPSFNNNYLPAIIAGGFDYIFKCPAKASVKSTGQKFNVPITINSYPVETYYEAAPSLMETAFLKATVKNNGKHPILKGKTNIFIGNSYIGEGELKTTGPSGLIDFPLGSDKDIKIKRNVVPSSDTEGILNKDDITLYNIKIEIGNYKKQPIKIRVIEQLPKTNNEKIQIKSVKFSPKPQKKPDADGIFYWEIVIEPSKTAELSFKYSIIRPEHWKLYN